MPLRLYRRFPGSIQQSEHLRFRASLWGFRYSRDEGGLDQTSVSPKFRVCTIIPACRVLRRPPRKVPRLHIATARKTRLRPAPASAGYVYIRRRPLHRPMHGYIPCNLFRRITELLITHEDDLCLTYTHGHDTSCPKLPQVIPFRLNGTGVLMHALKVGPGQVEVVGSRQIIVFGRILSIIR